MSVVESEKNSKKLPKLSYILLSHNREKYIRGAIESAFAQDYEGELEYIFSDDCSTDRTYEIIKECVAQYKGKRRVVVTQTPQNLHLAGNTNHAVQFATGDFVIRADDDDYSVVDRCTRIGQAIGANPGCSYVFADYSPFTDEEEAEIIQNVYVVSGNAKNALAMKIDDVKKSMAKFETINCLHQAWSIEVYRRFGNLPVDGYYVDDVISHFRALMLGTGVYISDILAYVRRENGNMSTGGGDGTTGFSAIMRLERFNHKYHNIILPPLRSTREIIRKYFSNSNHLISSARYNDIQSLIDCWIGTHELLSSYWSGSTWNRWRIRHSMKQTSFFSLLRCLPMPVFAFLLVICRKVKSLVC